MKNNRLKGTITLATAAAFIMLLASCGKKDSINNSNNGCGIDATAIKATINGGSFSNQTFSLASATTCISLSAYKADSLCTINGSGITSQNSSSELHVLAEFYANGQGNCNIETASGIAAMGQAYVQLDIVTGSGTVTLYSQSGTLNVTEIGASGGKISASFSGTFTDINNVTYTVTNGFVSGLRN